MASETPVPKPPRTWHGAIIGTVAIGSWAITIPVTFAILRRMFLNPAADTTLLSNVAFGVLMLMANVTFSYSRATDGDPAQRTKTVRAGEEFFFAALVFAAASVLKYATLRLVDGTWSVSAEDKAAYLPATDWASFACFLLAAFAAYVGIFTISSVLLDRRERR